MIALTAAAPPEMPPLMSLEPMLALRAERATEMIRDPAIRLHTEERRVLKESGVGETAIFCGDGRMSELIGRNAYIRFRGVPFNDEWIDASLGRSECQALILQIEALAETAVSTILLDTARGLEHGIGEGGR